MKLHLSTRLLQLDLWTFSMILIGVAAAVFLMYGLFFDQGLLSTTLGKPEAYLHELFHDARHAMGFPCH
jgi:hypothetical protein